MSGPAVFRYTLPMLPKTAPRPRGGRHNFYNPPEYTRWKADAALLLAAARANHQLPTIEVGCSLMLEFVLPRPKSLPAKGSLHRLYWQKGEDYPYPLRPDIDNLAKSIKDAMTQAHIWADDALIVETTQTKHAGDQPGVHITVHIVEPEQADITGVAAK